METDCARIGKTAFGMVVVPKCFRPQGNKGQNSMTKLETQRRIVATNRL